MINDTEYIVYIQTDFGELKIYFETDGILKNQEEVLSIALEKLEESSDIKLTGLLDGRLYYEVTEGKTLEDLWFNN